LTEDIAALAVGDVDGDGRAEVIVSTARGRVTIHAWQANILTAERGTFQLALHSFPGDGGWAYKIPARWQFADRDPARTYWADVLLEVGDLNGNGRAEIWSLERGGALRGHEWEGQDYQAWPSATPEASFLSFGDPDRDGQSELVLAGRTGPLRPHTVGRETVEAPAAEIWLLRAKEGPELQVEKRLAAPEVVWHANNLAVGDTNDDGKQEILCETIGPEGGKLGVTLGWDGQTFQIARQQPIRPPGGVLDWFTAMRIADLDGDGRGEILTADDPTFRDRAVRVLGLETGKIPPPALAVTNWDGQRYVPRWAQELQVTQVAAGDLNGDGTSELVAANERGIVVIFSLLGGPVTPTPKKNQSAIRHPPSAIRHPIPPQPPPTAAKPDPRAVVCGRSVNVRAGPGLDRPPVHHVEQGQRATVLERQGDWRRVRLESGTEGWIRADLLCEPAAMSATALLERADELGTEGKPLAALVLLREFRLRHPQSDRMPQALYLIHRSADAVAAEEQFRWNETARTSADYRQTQARLANLSQQTGVRFFLDTEMGGSIWHDSQAFQELVNVYLAPVPGAELSRCLQTPPDDGGELDIQAFLVTDLDGDGWDEFVALYHRPAPAPNRLYYLVVATSRERGWQVVFQQELGALRHARPADGPKELYTMRQGQARHVVVRFGYYTDTLRSRFFIVGPKDHSFGLLLQTPDWVERFDYQVGEQGEELKIGDIPGEGDQAQPAQTRWQVFAWRDGKYVVAREWVGKNDDGSPDGSGGGVRVDERGGRAAQSVGQLRAGNGPGSGRPARGVDGGSVAQRRDD